MSEEAEPSPVLKDMPEIVSEGQAAIKKGAWLVDSHLGAVQAVTQPAKLAIQLSSLNATLLAS
jgi:hypothetical protein